jgi:hypothetical protein
MKIGELMKCRKVTLEVVAKGEDSETFTRALNGAMDRREESQTIDSSEIREEETDERENASEIASSADEPENAPEVAVSAE